MGNNETRSKRGKTLSDTDVTELSNVSGFTPQQVREWHSGFLVSTPLSLYLSSAVTHVLARQSKFEFFSMIAIEMKMNTWRVRHTEK